MLASPLNRTRDWARRHRGATGLLAGLLIGAIVGAGATVVLDRQPPAGGLKPGELIILSGEDKSIGHQRHALVEQWNADPANPKARIVEVKGGADGQRSDMLRRAENPGDVDVFNLDLTWTAEFAERGYISALREPPAFLAGFLAKPLETCRYDGRLWALPFNTDAGLLFHNTDLLPEAPQTSWPGIRAATEQVFATDAATHPRLEAGFVGQFDNYEGLTVNALEIIWAFDGDVVDATGKVVVDSDQTRAALRSLATGMQRGNPQLILPQARSYDEESSTDAFRAGRVLFMRNWPVAQRQLGATEGITAPVRFATAPLPHGAVLGGQNLAVSSRSDQPRAAARLVEFLTGERSQQLLFERGGLAATREIVYRDRAIVERYPYADDLLEAVRGARLRPVTPRYARFSEVFRAGVRHALDNGGELPPRFTAQLEAALAGAPEG